MPRTLTADATAQLTGTLVRPLFLVSLQFVDQIIYVHTSVGNIVWNGNTYLGVGTLGKLSAVGEASDVNAQGITLTLSGIDATLLSESLGELTQSGIAKVYLGFLFPTGFLVDDPIPLFLGLMDQPQIDLGADTATITISVENRLSDLNRARGGRYTDQDQRQRYPNDGALRFVAFLQDTHINWR